MDKYINQFLTCLRYEKGYSAHTIESYKNDFTGFLSFLSKQNIHDIKAINYKILHLYITDLGRSGLKASSIERKAASLKSFFKYLGKIDVIENNPASLISSPRKEKRLPSILEKEEVLRLIASIPESDPLSVRNKAMVMLLYASGLRVSELTGLNLKDVDFKEGILSVTGKGSKQRIVPTGDTARQTLIKYLSYRRDLDVPKGDREALFLTKSGRRIQDRMVRYIINRYINELSIQKHISPHTLRHTFATHMLQNGAGIRVIQELLGHESLSTTQVYTHLTIDKLKESYDKFHPHA